MLARRAERLAAEPFGYHNTLIFDYDDFPRCGDCLIDDCPQRWRLLRRANERRLQLMKARGGHPF